MVLLLYAFSSLYIGYARNMGDNGIGMSFAQFVFLYLIGGFIHKFYSVEVFVRNRRRLLVAWFVFSSFTFALAVLNQCWIKCRIPVLRPYPYNSPWVLGASVCLLCLALSFSFYSKSVNNLSKSVLSAYLLQDSSYWGYLWLYPLVNSLMSHLPIAAKYVSLLFISILFLQICVLVDLVFVRFVYSPILLYYDRKVYPQEKRLLSFVYGFIDRKIEGVLNH